MPLLDACTLGGIDKKKWEVIRDIMEKYIWDKYLTLNKEYPKN